ncbi:hypothetical protein HY405_01195, partial [Candidatus Microgenomates bacterium]|nr:hypothetical protein [Candidatus Microgenomates bacterium]
MPKDRGPACRQAGTAPLLIVLILAAVAGTVLYFTKPWEKLNLPILSAKIVKPTVDVGRGRQLTVKPDKDNLIQVFDGQKVVTNVYIPKGAVKVPTIVEVFPFAYDEKAGSPTAGVLISPGEVSFLTPITLSFDLSRSHFRNREPLGKSQVLFLDKDAKSLTPTLVVRGAESAIQINARILTGGAYVFSLDGKNQVRWAREALDANQTNALIVLESASTLLSNNKKLSPKQKERVETVIKTIIENRDDSPIEASVAYSIQKRLETTGGLIPTVYAADAIRQYYETLCKARGQSVEVYLAFAKSAQIFGYSDIAEHCIVAAKNEVVRVGSQVLANSNNPAELVAYLSKVQLVGVDVETNLDENLLAKARDISIIKANEVLADPSATATQLAKALQDAANFGAPEETINQLAEKLQEKVDKGEIPSLGSPRPSASPAPGGDEIGLVDRVSIGAIAVALLQGFGLESFDQAGVQAWTKRMVATGREVNMMTAALCAAIGIDCSAQLAESERNLQQATELGFRAAEELGKIQAQDFQVPDYETDYEPLFPDEVPEIEIPEELPPEEPPTVESEPEPEPPPED